MKKGAILSEDEVYRYSLWRHWGPGHERVAFIMLNPSTADADEDDPTIRRCIGFTKRLEFDGLDVINLFAYRATDPKMLGSSAASSTSTTALRGPENEEHWARVLSTAVIAIAAWGANPMAIPSDWQRQALQRNELAIRLCSLGDLTKSGHPRHPLYLPQDAELRLFHLL